MYSRKSDPPDLQATQQQLVETRRELMRWKVLARQHEARIREMESTRAWRWSESVRAAFRMRHRLKMLALLAILLVLLFPLWPLIAILMLSSRGRVLLWSMLWKIRPLHDFVSFLKQKIQNRGGVPRGSTTALQPLVFRRPLADTAGIVRGETGQLSMGLLRQLSPQPRLLLERFRFTRGPLVEEFELPEVLSFETTETSVLRIAIIQSRIDDEMRRKLR